MTRVKICGIRRVEDAVVAAESGANFLGFVFYDKSRRALAPEEAREIIAVAREAGTARMVGVFVNAEPARINQVARVAGLDFAQLSGDERDESIAALDLPAIQVIHMRAEADDVALADRIHASPAELVLLDTPSAAYGGTGRVFDWSRVPSIDRPFLLAGGLHPDNVADAIARVHPWGVDVSSGVETNGEKDQARIRAFVAGARTASSRVSDLEERE